MNRFGTPPLPNESVSNSHLVGMINAGCSMLNAKCRGAKQALSGFICRWGRQATGI
jgi:hypothetical protein